MQDPRPGHLFRRIQTRAVMPNGKVVTSWNSYPLGTPYSTYRQIEQGLVRAYGPQHCRVEGTYMDGGAGTPA